MAPPGVPEGDSETSSLESSVASGSGAGDEGLLGLGWGRTAVPTFFRTLFPGQT